VDITVDPRERAKMICGNMTLDEKVTLLHGSGWGADVYVGKVPAIDRLKIPAMNLNDGPQGFRCNGLGKCPGGTSTCFPSGITMAATWDIEAMKDWGVAMGKEFYGKGANVQLGPGLCLARVPKNGRNFEYISGEDPYLGYKLVQPVVKGIQSQKVVANAKHYVLNNQETQRGSVSVVVDERTLFEMYLPPFKGAIDAGVGSFMCSYNKINGVYSCEQNSTLHTDLKERLGFEGWVMSDWRATHSTSIKQGLDQEMPEGNYFGDSLKNMVKSGAVSQAILDDSVIRVLFPMIQLGIFDDSNHNDINTNVSTAESMAVARSLAERSAILLKNDHHLLPINKTHLRKIAIIGGDAKNPTVHGEGSGKVNPSYLPTPYNSITSRFTPTKNNCSDGHFEVGIDYFGDNVGSDSGSGPADCCTKCAALKDCNYFSFKKPNGMCYFKVSNAGRQVNPDIVSGGCYASPVTVYYSADAGGDAADQAASSDLAIVFVSTSSGEGSDRQSLSYGSGDDMIKKIAGVQNNTVVIAVAPGAVLMPWVDKVASIIFSLMPGQMFADGLASLLLGDVSPSGKLPITLPNIENEQKFTPSQYPGVNGEVKYSEGLFVGYRWYDQNDVKPRFPFGHGLSYTSFSYTKLYANSSKVSCLIKNTGNFKAAEVVQFYLGFPLEAKEPPKVLRGFQKIELDLGETQQVVFPVTQNDTSIWDVTSHSWKVVKGTFKVFIGSSSRDIRLNGTFTL